ncbi:MAG: carboxylesterase family protein, partial [Myxococcota bacterium]
MSRTKLSVDSNRRAALWRGIGHWVGALGCALVCGCSATEEPPEPLEETLRETAQGQVIGFQSSDGAHVWRGIPFAKPPLGELRWRAPQPPDGWAGTRQALHFGEPCPQLKPPGAGGSGDTVGEEDCLTLNIYAPSWSTEEVPTGDHRLPVMVWIHGGGNSFGDAQIYDGSLLALSGPVIVVAIQYRLGVMG